jgi:catechol 2,3-dioxygenase-like lactoylglutathione lyase family enzyme
MTAKLRHIAISVPELRLAAEFYKKTFGLEEVNYVETPYGDGCRLTAST